MYRKPGILGLLLPYIMDKKNDLLDTFVRSTYNERPDNTVVNQCLGMILDTGAVASPSVMRIIYHREDGAPGSADQEAPEESEAMEERGTPDRLPPQTTRPPTPGLLLTDKK